MVIYIDSKLILGREIVLEVQKTIIQAKKSPKFIIREIRGQYFASQNPEGKSPEAYQVRVGNAAHFRYGWSWKNSGVKRVWLFKWRLINEESAEIRPCSYGFRLP